MPCDILYNGKRYTIAEFVKLLSENELINKINDNTITGSLADGYRKSFAAEFASPEKIGGDATIRPELADVESTAKALEDVDKKRAKALDGKDVWDSAKKAGSEHNDALESFEEQIKNEKYFLIEIPINKIIERDADVKDFLENDAINYNEFKTKRQIKQPIIIGGLNRGGPYYKNGVLDGGNRVAQAKLGNNQTTIKAYVPINSIFTSEAYHADKAAGKETELTKAVEELLGAPSVASPETQIKKEYDTENKPRMGGEVRVGEKPVETEPKQGAGREAAPTGRNVQGDVTTQEEKLGGQVTPSQPSPKKETKLQKQRREAVERVKEQIAKEQRRKEREEGAAITQKEKALKESVMRERAKSAYEGVLQFFAAGGKINANDFKKEGPKGKTELFIRSGKGGIVDGKNRGSGLDIIAMAIAEEINIPEESYDEMQAEILAELKNMLPEVRSAKDALNKLVEIQQKQEGIEIEEGEAMQRMFEQKQFEEGALSLTEYYTDDQLRQMAEDADMARVAFEKETVGVEPTKRQEILSKRNEIKERIKQKQRGRLNAIPVDLIGDYIELAMTYAQEGVLNTKEFVRRFKADNKDLLTTDVTDNDLEALHNFAIVQSGEVKGGLPLPEAPEAETKQKEKSVEKRIAENKAANLKLKEEALKNLLYDVENRTNLSKWAGSIVKQYKDLFGSDWKKILFDDVLSGKFIEGDLAESGIETMMFKELIENAESPQEKSVYINQLSIRLRGAGRRVAAVADLYINDPDFIVRKKQDEIADSFEKATTKGKKESQIKPKLEEKGKELGKAKQEAIDEAASEVTTKTFGKESLTPKQRKERGKAKVESAKNKLRFILSNSSSSFDVMNEWKKGGDFANALIEMAQGYVDMGIADAQKLAEKIKQGLSDAGFNGDDFEQIKDDFLKAFNLDARVEDRIRAEGSEKLAQKIANRAKERKEGKEIDPLQVLVDTLFRKAEESMPKRTEKGERLTAQQKIQMALENYTQYKNVWDESKAEFEQIVDQLPISDAQKDKMKQAAKDYFESELGIPYSDKSALAAVKEQIAEVQLNVKDVLLSANEIQASTKEDFVQQLTDKLVADAGLSPELAAKVAERFEQKYTEVLTQKVDSLLKQGLPLQKAKLPKAKKRENQRIVELIKYGLFDGKELSYKDKNGVVTKMPAYQVFAEKFGFPSQIDPEIQEQLKAWAERIVKLPENSIQRENAVKLFENYILFLTNKNSIITKMLGMGYGNILFDPNTWINVFRGGLFRSLNEALIISARKLTTEVVLNPGRIKDFAVIFETIMKSRSFNESYGTLRYGSVRRGEESARPIYAEMKAQYAKNPISKAYWNFQMMSGRIMSALDALFTEPFTDIRYADLILDKIYNENKKLPKDQRMTGAEVRQLASYILGNSNDIIQAAEAQAMQEFEKEYGPDFKIKGEIGVLWKKRVEQIIRETSQQKGAQMLPPQIGIAAESLQETWEEASKVSGEIGMVGNPPGTVGLFTALVKEMMGATMLSAWFSRFMGSIMYSAKFVFDGSPLGIVTLVKNASTSQRGFGQSNEKSQRIYKENRIRTEYYGYKGNLEKREAIIRWVTFQAFSASVLMAMYGDTILNAISSAGGDEEEEEKALAGKQLRDKLFGEDLKSEEWKKKPLFVTGRLFGSRGKNYQQTTAFCNATGLKPYSVYIYGSYYGTYQSDPTLMTLFGTAGLMSDAMMFNDKISETDLGVLANASVDQGYLILESSTFKNIADLVNMFSSRKEYAELKESDIEKKLKFSLKKLSDEARNILIPRALITVENNTEAILGEADRLYPEWYQFALKDWPILNNFLGADIKYDHFGDEIPKKTNLKSPFLVPFLDFKDGAPYSPFLNEVVGGPNADLYKLFMSKNSIAYRFADSKEFSVYNQNGQPVKGRFTEKQFLDYNKQVAQEFKKYITENYEMLRDLPGNPVLPTKEKYEIQSSLGLEPIEQVETGLPTFDSVVSQKKKEIKEEVFSKMFPNYIITVSPF